eukprot:1159874-Pelagomonas_calceolata.AAC.3
MLLPWHLKMAHIRQQKHEGVRDSCRRRMHMTFEACAHWANMKEPETVAGGRCMLMPLNTSNVAMGRAWQRVPGSHIWCSPVHWIRRCSSGDEEGLRGGDPREVTVTSLIYDPPDHDPIMTLSTHIVLPVLTRLREGDPSNYDLLGITSQRPFEVIVAHTRGTMQKCQCLELTAGRDDCSG